LITHLGVIALFSSILFFYFKRNKTKPTKAKRNQRKQNKIENGRKNNRGLKEIKPIFLLSVRSFVRPVVTLFRLSDTLLNFARTGVFINEL
jgi:hypothetical protein